MVTYNGLRRSPISTNFYGNSAFRCSSRQHAPLRRVKQRPPIWDTLRNSSSSTPTSKLSSLTFTRPSANSPSTRRCDCVILQRHPDSMLQTQHADRDIKLDRANKLVSPTQTSQTTCIACCWFPDLDGSATRHVRQERVLLLHELATCTQTSQVTGSNTRTTSSSRRHATSK